MESSMAKNMKKVLFLFPVFWVFISYGQKNIVNTVTPRHETVPGIAVRMIPPPNFILAEHFAGFQEAETGSSIMITCLPAAFYDLTARIDEKELLHRGIRINETERFSINGAPALLISGRQTLYGMRFRKYILVSGNSSESFIINASTLSKYRKSHKRIRESLLSVYSDSTMVTNPRDGVDFTLDYEKGGLQTASTVARSFIFNRTGTLPSPPPDKTTLLVTKSFFAITINDQRQYSIQRFSELHGGPEQIETIEEITLDGITGYKISAIVTQAENGEEETVHQIMLFDNGFYYLMIATTSVNTPEYMEELDKVMYTFRKIAP